MKSLALLALSTALAAQAQAQAQAQTPTSTPAQAQAPTHCLIGAYRLADGRTLDLSPARGHTLRWTLFNGDTGRLRLQADGSWASTRGWTDQPAAQALVAPACGTATEPAPQRISFDGQAATRLAFDVTDTTFRANGTTLAGRLVMPRAAAGASATVPVVVLLHGSESDAARDTNGLQRSLPAEGVGVFVFDKRGTGASGGAYTQDVDVLADDAVQAMKEARRLAGARAGRVGYQGGSQGGWVAPLAAQRAPVDFAIVSFGLTVSMFDQDLQAVAMDLQAQPHSEQDLAKALALARAGQRVIETRGREGYEAFDALRQQYRAEPWFQQVRGNFLHLVLPLDQAQIVHGLNTQYNFAASFRYDPLPTLRAATTPQLWVLARDDRVAPSAESAASIRTLIAAGRPYTLAVYPGTDHGMTEFERRPDGQRVGTRFAPGYFEMMRDFIRDGRLARDYGQAVITRQEAPRQ